MDGSQQRVHANLLQGLPIADLCVFNGLEQKLEKLALVRTHAARVMSPPSSLSKGEAGANRSSYRPIAGSDSFEG